LIGIQRRSTETKRVADEIEDYRPIIINNSNEHSYAKEIANYFSIKTTVSFVSLFIPTTGSQYAGLTFAAYGKNRYQPVHVDLINHIPDSLIGIVHQISILFEKDCLKKSEILGGS
jgi:alpha-L-fucosidase